MTNLAIVLAIVLSVLSMQVSAQELSRSVATRVHQAYELQNKDNNVKAIQTLEKIKGNHAYDTAFVQRMLGILYWQQKQNNQAEEALTQAVSVNGLPIEQQIETQRMLGDIQLSNGHTRKALATYHQVIVQNNTHKIIDATSIQQVWLRIAQGNYQLEEWKAVIAATHGYRNNGGKVTVPMLNLRLGAELSLKRWNSALKTTLILRGFEPEQSRWWLQTLNLYLRVEQFPQALATLKQYERAGFSLTDAQYRLMAQLYSKQKVPQKSAEIFHLLNKADNSKANDLAREAQYWQQARDWEQSLSAWSRAVEKDRKYQWSYIQLLMQHKQYKTALTQLNSVKSSSRRELTRVDAYYRLGDKDRALRHAQKANQIESSQSALNWIRYLTQIQ
ncbi:hypothetical protein A9264_11825 [Vibrio sp. UCD-FRSSP16_10]|uniref:tetratricopeptide repeat protein n=1 Tax=unclassified Vibrio TaxID=2614977 RepID=UPI0007FC73A4|nr:MULTISPECIES: hypothetical protein [unclassified Vibrio]OBT16322.1 hypothetical protein A9260_12035 [Vibrio sp. UCD-FRSSP16_30]OBT21187.1 hypothetical protein A9264_11825 [Vibrio sp. UCD-FRSSP16_10]